MQFQFRQHPGSIFSRSSSSPSRPQVSSSASFVVRGDDSDNLRRSLSASCARLRHGLAALRFEMTRLAELNKKHVQPGFREDSEAKLGQLRQKYDQIKNTADRVKMLERTIQAAQAEFSQLSWERDEMLKTFNFAGAGSRLR